MWSDVDRVRVDFIRFQRFFFKTVVGPTYNWFCGPHIRWDPLLGLVSPQWGPLESYGAHGGAHMWDPYVGSIRAIHARSGGRDILAYVAQCGGRNPPPP